VLAVLLADHGPTEISRMLGIARSTVYARIARLRRAFRAAGYGPPDSKGGSR
jgi:DNA-directed RNA polymerase specialized sigma24 family protein